MLPCLFLLVRELSVTTFSQYLPSLYPSPPCTRTLPSCTSPSVRTSADCFPEYPIFLIATISFVAVLRA